MPLIRKITVIIMILLIVGSITSCKSDNFEIEPLNVKIIDDTNPAFNCIALAAVHRTNVR